jgi:hypothetical protein
VNRTDAERIAALNHDLSSVRRAAGRAHAKTARCEALLRRALPYVVSPGDSWSADLARDIERELETA